MVMIIQKEIHWELSSVSMTHAGGKRFVGARKMAI